MKPLTMASVLVDVASKEIGVEEVNGTNCGPRVNEYKAATNLPPKESWPWCAAFVCFCVREAMAKLGIKETETFKRPTTAGAYDLANWSRKQDNTTWTRFTPDMDIAAGDIIVYTFSHCGIAVTPPSANGTFFAIEGNTDGGGSREGGIVMKKLRKTSQVRARIRFRA